MLERDVAHEHVVHENAQTPHQRLFALVAALGNPLGRTVHVRSIKISEFVFLHERPTAEIDQTHLKALSGVRLRLRLRVRL